MVVLAPPMSLGLRQIAGDLRERYNGLIGDYRISVFVRGWRSMGRRKLTPALPVRDLGLALVTLEGFWFRRWADSWPFRGACISGNSLLVGEFMASSTSLSLGHASLSSFQLILEIA